MKSLMIRFVLLVSVVLNVAPTDATQARKSCQMAGKSCFNYGAKYFTGSFQELITDTAAKCGEMCKNNKKCFSFNYKVGGNGNNCFLNKLGRTKKTLFSNAVNFISGEPNCCNPIGSCLHKTIEGTNYSRGKLQMLVGTIRSFPVCARLCYSNVMCRYFAYRSGTRSCYLKESYAKNLRDSRFVSGEIRCKGRVESCITKRADTNFYGGTRMTPEPIKYVNTAKDCAKACMSLDRCNYYVHRGSTHQCWLKMTYDRKDSKRGYTSGAVDCKVMRFADTTGTSFTLHPNVNLSGADRIITITNYKSIAGCARLCNAASECTTFVHNGRATCYLKKTGSLKSVPKNGFLSGQK